MRHIPGRPCRRVRRNHRLKTIRRSGVHSSGTNTGATCRSTRHTKPRNTASRPRRPPTSEEWPPHTSKSTTPEGTTTPTSKQNGAAYPNRNSTAAYARISWNWSDATVRIRVGSTQPADRLGEDQIGDLTLPIAHWKRYQ